MSEQLGRLEKPDAESFRGKRKLLLVTPLFSNEQSPEEYVEKVGRYWEQVSQHIAGLEAKLGAVTVIYHESISRAGEDGIIVLEQLNPSSSQIVKEWCDRGAVLEAVEDRETLEEAMDWERFLILGFVSDKVAGMVRDFYIQTTKKRYEHIAGVIDRTLKADGVGVLFIREGHSVQFPPGIEVFIVAPPTLDEIRRWQREYVPPDEEDTATDSTDATPDE